MNFDNNISCLNLDNEILTKLYNLNINKINELWKCNAIYLKEHGIKNAEINIIRIKLQLLSIDLNSKIYRF